MSRQASLAAEDQQLRTQRICACGTCEKCRKKRADARADGGRRDSNHVGAADLAIARDGIVSRPGQILVDTLPDPWA